MTRKRHSSSASALALLAAMVTVMTSERVTADQMVRIREQVRSMMQETHVPGVSIAVLCNGGMVWSEGFGYANLELKVPVTSETRFRIASITKAMTATGMARLYEAGALDLDAPIQRYVAAFPDKGVPITVRQLASHRSGIEHYGTADMLNTVNYSDMSAAIAKFKDRPLLGAPGGQFIYSSFGYTLIGAAIEGATGKSFTAYLEESVLGPLRMTHTVPDGYEEIIPNRTAFYVIDAKGAVHNAPAVDNSDLWAAGGYLSTAEDLVRFGDAVVNGPFLKPQTRDLVLTPVTENLKQGESYGLGWQSSLRHGLHSVGHKGSHFGALSILTAYREKRLVIAVLVNASLQGNASDLRERLETPVALNFVAKC